MIALLISLILICLALVFAFFPRIAWYYVLSGHWGRNENGAPTDVQLMVVRTAAALPLLAFRFLMLG